MARFLKIENGEFHDYWLNLEQIEQVNPESNEVWMQSGECYTLSDSNFVRVMGFVEENEYEAEG